MNTLFPEYPNNVAMGISGTARFGGPDDCYRYLLTRTWDSTTDLSIAFIGLNPSTADADTDDNTIRRCIAFARRWGFSNLAMVNLFAVRATLPRDMMLHPDPVGPDNDAVLIEVLSTMPAIAAWGVDGSHRRRDQEVSALVERMGRPLYCLGTNVNGSPKHPLYLPSGALRVPYRLEPRP